MASRIIDVAGKTFGRLTVVGRAVKDIHDEDGRLKWLCLCECGKEIRTRSSHLIMGRTKSCGCLKIETITSLRKTHGESDKTSENKAWQAMRYRCLNKEHDRYRYYGGKGIGICQRWLDSYENFLADMGRKPSPKHSLDRIDGDKDYSPGNCRWASWTEQANNKGNNRIIQYGYCRRTMAQWARTRRMSYSALSRRLDLGWSIHDALFKPVKKYQHPKKTVDIDYLAMID